MESQNESSVSTFQRWLGFIPVLIIFLIMAWIIPRGRDYIDAIRWLRVELPLPTVLAIFWCEKGADYFWLWMPAMLAVSWFYFGFAAKKRNRLLTANILLTCACLLTAHILIGGLLMPYIKIQEALTRR